MLFCCLFYSCDKYFEEDISTVEMELISPADNLHTDKLDVTFWWGEVDEATKYHLEVVTPSFESMRAIVIDTLIESTKLSVELVPDSYEWRVRAQNASSNTTYFHRMLFIDSSMYLTNKNVELYSPQENEYLNSDDVSFSWKALPFTDRYAFSLSKIENEEQFDIISFETTVNEILLSRKLQEPLADGEYWWSVYAENALSETKASSTYFYVDKTAPIEPELLFPQLNDTVSSLDDIILQWQDNSDASGLLKDSLYVYELTHPDDQEPFLLLREAVVDEQLKLDDLRQGYWYRWYVVSVDRAGNASRQEKAVRMFYVN